MAKQVWNGPIGLGIVRAEYENTTVDPPTGPLRQVIREVVRRSQQTGKHQARQCSGCGDR